VYELQPADPQRIGPYWIEARLGSGGMGRVYLGRSPGGRHVAIKVIRPELAEDAEFRARFGREVSAARKVSGIFTAPVVDADLDGPIPWLATSYVAGPSLADVVATRGPLPVGLVLALAARPAEGLAAIHSAGVVHRDLKPSNVLLAEDGPRLIDFGISRSMEASPLTGTGTVVGSPGFMSPEQAQGREAGPPSDIFSLGAVLAFAATGEGPFGEGSTISLLYRVVASEPNTSGLPAEIRPLIDRCLAKDPWRRPTAAALLTELSTVPPAPQALPGPAGPAPGGADKGLAVLTHPATQLAAHPTLPPGYGGQVAAPPGCPAARSWPARSPPRCRIRSTPTGTTRAG
jgi:serine/threonine protein kinase